MKQDLVTLECSVAAVNCLGADVHEVVLQLPEGEQANFKPGQYLMLASLQGNFLPFSIASAPHESEYLRLHILACNADVVRLLDELQRDDKARVRLAFGDVTLDLADTKPLLLIAAGTGVAQMHSIIEQLIHLAIETPIKLYWGAKVMTDFYRLANWEKWQALPNIELHKVVSSNEGLAETTVKERNGMLYEAVIKDIADLRGYRVIASGSPAMVYGTFDALLEHGMQPEQMQADVFSYAPRTSGAN